MTGVGELGCSTIVYTEENGSNTGKRRGQQTDKAEAPGFDKDIKKRKGDKGVAFLLW